MEPSRDYILRGVCAIHASPERMHHDASWGGVCVTCALGWVPIAPVLLIRTRRVGGRGVGGLNTYDTVIRT